MTKITFGCFIFLGYNQYGLFYVHYIGKQKLQEKEPMTLVSIFGLPCAGISCFLRGVRSEIAQNVLIIDVDHHLEGVRERPGDFFTSDSERGVFESSGVLTLEQMNRFALNACRDWVTSFPKGMIFTGGILFTREDQRLLRFLRSNASSFSITVVHLHVSHHAAARRAAARRANGSTPFEKWKSDNHGPRLEAAAERYRSIRHLKRVWRAHEVNLYGNRRRPEGVLYDLLVSKLSNIPEDPQACGLR